MALNGFKKVLSAIGLEPENDYEPQTFDDQRSRGGRYEPYDEDGYEQRARNRSNQDDRYESPRDRDRDRDKERDRDKDRDRERQPREERRSSFDDYSRGSGAGSYDETRNRRRGGGDDGGNVVQFRGGSSSPAIRHHLEILNMHSYDDARTVIDNLIDDRSVSINLEYVDLDVSQRIVDMLSGAIYALNATLTKTGMNSYLLAPASVEVVGSYDLEDDEPHSRRGGGLFGGRK